MSQAAAIAIQLASTVILARLLTPQDYGTLAMVTAITGVAALFRDLGLSSSTVQRAELTAEQLSTMHWINVCAGTLLTCVTAAASPIVAWFYGRPELTAVTLVVALSFAIGSFGTQPGALLTRQLRFGRIATATLSGAVCGLTASIALAAAGYSYWSLVGGSLLNAFVTTILLNVLSGWRPGGIVKGSGIRAMLTYGANITAFDFVSYVHRNLDNVLIGRFWGTDALGIYTRAYALLMFPIANIRGPINAVAFPVMSRLQHQPALLREYYIRATSLLAFASMPLTAFAFVASEPLIELLLGRNWLGVSPIFAFLAVAGFVQPAAGLVGTLLLSLGRSRRYLQFGIFNTVILSASFVIGVAWGPLGVAIAYAIANYVVLVPSMTWALRDSPVSVRDFARACAPAVLGSFLAVGLAAVARLYTALLPPIVQLSVCALAFTLILLPVLVFTKLGATVRVIAAELFLSRVKRHRG